MNKTLILTDNRYALELARELKELHGGVDIFQSPKGPLSDIPRLALRERESEVIRDYDLIISIHCKQMFSANIVNNIRCVNVHPGYNPYNRGWYPQVFSIINGLPLGVTIHEMDEQMDHGPIIIQKLYDIKPWDTSGSAYAELMVMERDLLLKNYTIIRDNLYAKQEPESEGNVNYKSDFVKLSELDLSEMTSVKELIKKLRALSHYPFDNCYYRGESGKKIYIKLDVKVGEVE